MQTIIFGLGNKQTKTALNLSIGKNFPLDFLNLSTKFCLQFLYLLMLQLIWDCNFHMALTKSVFISISDWWLINLDGISKRSNKTLLFLNKANKKMR